MSDCQPPSTLTDQMADRLELARLAHEVDRLLVTPKATSWAIQERIKAMRQISPNYADEYVAQVRREYGVSA